MFVLSVYFYGMSFRKIALLDQLKLFFYIHNQICYRFFFLRNNSIQILVVLVVAELHIDKPLSEKKKKKKKTKINQTNPKHLNYSFVCFSFTWCWFSISFKSFLSFSKVGRSSGFSRQQSCMILYLQIRIKGLMSLKGSRFTSLYFKYLSLLLMIYCKGIFYFIIFFSLLKVYRSWRVIKQINKPTWITQGMSNNLNNQEIPNS